MNFIEIYNAIKDKFLQKTCIFDKIFEYWNDDAFDFGDSCIETSFWDSTDNEENFETRGNKTYNKTEIIYNLNVSGFRLSKNTEHTVSNPSTIACFGCSHTFGVGLKYEDTWPSILETLLEGKYQVNNYGISGASLDTISRVIYSYLLTQTPSIICCLLPDIFRRELFDSDSTESPNNYMYIGEDDWVFGSSLKEKCEKANFPFLDYRAYRRFTDEPNCIFNFIRNLKFIESMCNQHNIPILFATWDSYTLNYITTTKHKSIFNNFATMTKSEIQTFLNWLEGDKARDGIHFGKTTSQKYANLFYKNIQALKAKQL